MGVEARKLQSQAVAAKVESFSRQKVKSKMWQQAAICALLISSVRGVSIAKESSASVAVQFGQELLLDCDFIFDKEEEEELVVKWFFNASTTPFYQWVTALDVGPQVIMREAPGEIDINYSVEGENSFTKHRRSRMQNRVRFRGRRLKQWTMMTTTKMKRVRKMRRALQPEVAPLSHPQSFSVPLFTSSFADHLLFHGPKKM